MNESAHTIKSISVVNPELANLISKTQVVYLATGGHVPKTQLGEKVSKYERVKLKIKSQLENIDQIQERLKSGLYEPDSREYISMKNSLRTEYQSLVSNINEFSSRAKSHTSDEEIQIQKEIIQQANTILPQHKKFYNLETNNPILRTTDEIISGAVQHRQEIITGQQLQTINEINEETKLQDELLDNISASLENLRQIANNASDILQHQDQLLKVVIEKTDDTTEKLTNTTEKTSNVLKKINSRSGKICAYIICCLILFGLASVAYRIMV